MKRFTRTIFSTGLFLLLTFFAVAQPIAGFVINAPSPLCNPATISFVNTSTGDAPLSYLWVFGNSSLTDTVTNPSYTADTCGLFEIVLIVIDSSGHVDKDTQLLLISCPPIADFSVTPAVVCDSTDVLFSDESSPADSVMSWLWDFGDPASGILNTSSLQNPSHHYDTTGVFYATLTVTLQSGCSDTTTDSVIVSYPFVFFSISDTVPCVNDSVLFFDESVSEDSIVSWFWNFGGPPSGNNTSSEQNPVYVYSTPGEYLPRLTITTESGCSVYLKKEINVVDLPIVDAGEDQSICPLDSVKLLATGGITYQWSPGFLLNDSSASDPFAFPIFSTLFFVTGTDTNGCKGIDSVAVNVLPVPPADAGNDTAICAGTSATLHASGGVSFLWTPPVNISNDTIADPVVSPTSTTTYTVTVKDSSGCTAADSVTVIISPFPVVTITGLDSNYCGNGPPVELTATPGGGIFTGDGVAGGLFNPQSLATGGPYSIIYLYTDSVGCSGSDTSSVIILNIPAVSISASDSSLCLNAEPLEIIRNPAGGILSGAGIIDSTFDPALAGTSGTFPIYYTITDSAGCSNTDTLDIMVFALPTIDAGHDTTICGGDTIQLQASGGSIYLWTPDSTLSDGQDATPLAYPLATTQYILSATDTNSCSGIDSILITVFSPANVDAGPDVAICMGDSTELHAMGGATYIWSPELGLSDPDSASTIASPTITTVYTVSVNDGTNCPAYDSVTVTVHSLPIVIASQDSSFCFGDSIQLFASGALSYVWLPDTSLSNNQIPDPLASPESTTIYMVTGTDSNNCANTDSVILTVLPLPVIDAGIDSTICLGDSLELSASGGSEYLWSPSVSLTNDTIANPTAFPDSTTLYFVTGTDLSGCSNTDSVIILVLSSNSIDAGNDTSLCLGDSITLQASGGLNYSWSPAAGLNDTSIANPNASPQVTTVYTVTVTAGLDCSFWDSVKITVNTLPLIDAGEDTSVCPGDSVQLFAVGGTSYVWSPGNTLSSNTVANPFAFPSTNTQYIVTGSDTSGCKNDDTVIVSILAAPIANAGNDTSMCIGDSIMLQSSGGLTYEWSPSSGLTNPTIADPIAFPLTTTQYIVSVNDGGSCFGYDTVNVIVYPLPNANAGNDSTVCSGSYVQLAASGGLQYEWSPDEGLSNTSISNPIALIDSGITYSVIVTNANNCSSSDSVQINVVLLLNAFISNDTTICKGTAAQLSAGGGVTYHWSPQETLDNPAIANPLATPDTSAIYSVIVSDGICYSDTLMVSVSVSSPEINAGSDASITSGENYQLSATGSPGTYQWSPSEGLSCLNCLNPSASPEQTTTYTVTVIDAFGCTASDDVTLSTGCGDDVVYIPNAFTPNNNGKNDVLLVRSYGATKLNYLRVFDRWGALIFESNDISNGWDGTYKNKLMSPGVYIYMAEAECANGDVVQKNGNVTLLR